MPNGEMRLFSCKSGEYFAKKVASILNSNGACEGLERYPVMEFANGERKCYGIERSVRMDDAYLFQEGAGDTELSVDDRFMDLCRAIDGLKNGAHAKNVTVVMPLMPYARQDKVWTRGESFTAKLAANFLEGAGADRLVTMDLHADQIKGFFDIPVEGLYFSNVALPVLREEFGKLNGLENCVFLATDAGGAERAKHWNKNVAGSGLAFGSKTKSYDESGGKTVERVEITGEVNKRRIVIIEDMVDTGGSVIGAAKAAKEMGALSVDIVAGHGIFSGKAFENLDKAYGDGLIRKVHFSDSVNHGDKLAQREWVNQISVDELFARVIEKLHKGEGVSEVYRGG